jgi:hypothetical protein
VIIEYSNATSPKNHSTMAVAIVITACAFFFIPTTLIILGYYSTQPTGTLISPIPQGVLSEQPTPTPIAAENQPLAETVTPTLEPENQPIIAADNTATQAATSDVAPVAESNIIDKVATIDSGVTEVVITDSGVTDVTQVYLSPRVGDKSVYSVKTKGVGQFTIAVSDASDTVRYVDYHIVTP